MMVTLPCQAFQSRLGRNHWNLTSEETPAGCVKESHQPLSADSILFRIENNQFLQCCTHSIVSCTHPSYRYCRTDHLTHSSHHDHYCEMYLTTPIISSGKLASLALLLLGLHPSAVNSVTFDCKQVVIGDVKLDLSPLTGPHSVSMLQRTPTAIKNTTFTIDICKPLYKSGDKPKSAECPNGSRGKTRQHFTALS
jgi:hypothetical protein